MMAEEELYTRLIPLKLQQAEGRAAYADIYAGTVLTGTSLTDGGTRHNRSEAKLPVA